MSRSAAPPVTISRQRPPSAFRIFLPTIAFAILAGQPLIAPPFAASYELPSTYFALALRSWPYSHLPAPFSVFFPAFFQIVVITAGSSICTTGDASVGQPCVRSHSRSSSVSANVICRWSVAAAATTR